MCQNPSRLPSCRSSPTSHPPPCRVSIGQELVAAEGAAVLLLDEPSSGLDSHAALHLMQTLKQVWGGLVRAEGNLLCAGQQPSVGCTTPPFITAGQWAQPLLRAISDWPGLLSCHRSTQLMSSCAVCRVQVALAGRIVLLSCHQPSPAMFALLDRAYLLAGGACVFAGPPAAVQPHFAALGLPCPPVEAPAEHMLEVGRDAVAGFGCVSRVAFKGLQRIHQSGGGGIGSLPGPWISCSLPSCLCALTCRWLATRSSWSCCCKRQVSVTPMLVSAPQRLDRHGSRARTQF